MILNHPELEWFKISKYKPPENELLVIFGPSGMVTHKHFMMLSYYNESFRSSHGGPIRWQTVTNDDVTDTYPEGPTHWAYRIKYPHEDSI